MTFHANSPEGKIMITVNAHDHRTGNLEAQFTADSEEQALAQAALLESEGLVATIVNEYTPEDTGMQDSKLLYGPVNADGSTDVFLADNYAEVTEYGRLMPASDAPQRPKNLAMRLIQERVERERMLADRDYESLDEQVINCMQGIADEMRSDDWSEWWEGALHSYLVNGGDL